MIRTASKANRRVPAFARRILALLVLLALVAGSAIAGGGQEEGSGAGEAETVTLEYWHWNPEQSDMIDGIIADFEEEHPSIQVDVTAMVPSDYWTKIRLQANQQALPDVFDMSSGFIETWANDGFLYDLSDYVASSPEADEYYESLVESARTLAGTDGYHALPYAFVIPVLYFNKDKFDDAGVSYPNDSWTWSDFADAARALTVDTDGDGEPDQWGHHFYGRYAHVEPWVYANNGRLIDRDAMRFAPDENAREALEFLVSLVDEHEVVPQPKTVADMGTADVFATGVSAMWVDGSWNIGYMRDNVGDEFNWGIAPVPTGPSGDGSLVYGWADFIAMGADTDEPDAAWQLLTYLTGEGRTLANFSAGKIPSYRALAEDPAFLEPDMQPDEKGILLDLAQREPVTSFTKAWSEWRGYGPAESMGFNAIMDAVLNDEFGYGEALSRADENLNEILAREY